MSNIARKATIAIVKIGPLEFEGLMLVDNTFAISVPQLVNVFPFFQSRQNEASKTLKRLMGKGFRPGKTATESTNALVGYVTVDQFVSVIKTLARKGDTVALDLIDALVGLSLVQLFSDAFGIKFEKDDRQQYLTKRQTHKEQFHPQYTVWLKKDAGGDSSAVNWGSKVNELKVAAGVPLTFIDEYNPAEYATIDKLNRAYSSYNSLRLAGISHEGAIGVLKLQNN